MSEQFPPANIEAPVEKLLRPPKTFLEVGIGFYRQSGYQIDYPFQEGDSYITLDLPVATGSQTYTLGEAPVYVSRPQIQAAINQQPLDANVRIAYLHQDLMEATAEEKGVNFAALYGDGRELPIADHAIDEVLLSNVLGEPLIADDDKKHILVEACRVIKPEGRVVVAEYYSPERSKNIIERFNHSDFSVEAIRPGEAGWHELAEQYSAFATGNGVAYIFTARPSESTE